MSQSRFPPAVLRSLILFAAAVLFPVSAQSGAEAPRRIVSVGGALTEIIYALGAQDALVGGDTTSYYPPAAAALPKVGYMRALSAEGILSLKPDLLILTAESGPAPVLAQLKLAGVKMLTLKPGRSLEDVKESARRIAAALGRKKEGAALTRKMDAEIQKLAEAAAAQPVRKRALFIMNHGGGAPMVAGRETAADAIIRLSGAANAADDYAGYKPLTPEAAAALEPDVILTTTQGLERAGGAEGFMRIPGVALTPAAQNGKVIAMDALLLLGFGPRTAKAALDLSAQYRGQDDAR